MYHSKQASSSGPAPSSYQSSTYDDEQIAAGIAASLDLIAAPLGSKTVPRVAAMPAVGAKIKPNFPFFDNFGPAYSDKDLTRVQAAADLMYNSVGKRPVPEAQPESEGAFGGYASHSGGDCYTSESDSDDDGGCTDQPMEVDGAFEDISAGARDAYASIRAKFKTVADPIKAKASAAHAKVKSAIRSIPSSLGVRQYQPRSSASANDVDMDQDQSQDSLIESKNRSIELDQAHAQSKMLIQALADANAKVQAADDRVQSEKETRLKLLIQGDKAKARIAKDVRLKTELAAQQKADADFKRIATEKLRVQAASQLAASVEQSRVAALRAAKSARIEGIRVQQRNVVIARIRDDRKFEGQSFDAAVLVLSREFRRIGRLHALEHTPVDGVIVPPIDQGAVSIILSAMDFCKSQWDAAYLAAKLKSVDRWSVSDFGVFIVSWNILLQTVGLYADNSLGDTDDIAHVSRHIMLLFSEALAGRCRMVSLADASELQDVLQKDEFAALPLVYITARGNNDGEVDTCSDLLSAFLVRLNHRKGGVAA
jgi:hypothetical protein